MGDVEVRKAADDEASPSTAERMKNGVELDGMGLGVMELLVVCVKAAVFS